MPEFATTVLDFIRTHQAWAAPIVFLLAFGESLAIFALILPASIILWGVGALIGAASLDFWPIWIAAVIGAGLGDWVSYWLGRHFHDPIARMWPLSRYPELLKRGHVFFEKYGALGVFGGRFIGPLRAVVPLAAGACQMHPRPFHIANWTSALGWATLTLAPGALGADFILAQLGWGGAFGAAR